MLFINLFNAIKKFSQFIALTLKPNIRYTQHFETDLHVSAAVLDVESLNKNSKKGVQVWTEKQNDEHLIVNLCRQTTQFPLDIGFSKGERVEFFTKGGPGTVYLHGYFVPEDDEGIINRTRFELFKI